MKNRISFLLMLGCWMAWIATTSATNLSSCQDYSDCSGWGMVCVNNQCAFCDADPDQCNEDSRVCDGTYCVEGDCDPYDMWNTDCHPQTCDMLLLMCRDCSYNPGQCPPTTFCDEFFGECVPIPGGTP